MTGWSDAKLGLRSNLLWLIFVFCHQEVEPNSPAALAGLRPHMDYIIGADSVMNEVCLFIRTFDIIFTFYSIHQADLFKSEMKCKQCL